MRLQEAAGWCHQELFTWHLFGEARVILMPLKLQPLVLHAFFEKGIQNLEITLLGSCLRCVWRVCWFAALLCVVRPFIYICFSGEMRRRASRSYLSEVNRFQVNPIRKIRNAVMEHDGLSKSSRHGSCIDVFVLLTICVIVAACHLALPQSRRTSVQFI